MNYWLLKTEPSTYSFANLQKDRKTNWSGVRNFQARNFLREVAKGDLALVYHSGDDKAVIGIAKILREAYPDLDPENPGDWVQIDIAPVEPLAEPVKLATIKKTPGFTDLLLVKNSRLSVMPVSAAHYKRILRLGGAS